MEQTEIVDILHQIQDELVTSEDYEKHLDILIDKIEADIAKEVKELSNNGE